MSDSDESADVKRKMAREAEVEQMLEHRFRHLDRSHPAVAALVKEARRHWVESLEGSDDG